jgi:hypothetical protein
MCYRVAFKWASGPTIVPSVVDGETTHLRRNLGAEPQVEVRVLVGDGEDLAPAPGIPVVIEATEGTSETVGDALPVLARTDAEGRTRFLGLDPTGRYRLKVDGKEEREAWKPEDTIVRRAPDEALAGLGFRLLSLTLRVKGARRADEGKPVLWRWGKGGVRSTAVDGDGRASVWYDEEEAAEPLELWIPGLHGGKYVHALGLRASEEQIQVEAKQGETIRGRIDAAEGLSAAAPTAFLMGPLIMVSIDPEGWPGTIPVEIDFETGRFEILGVPPGTWTIHVWGRLQGEAASWEVEAKAGDEDVVIRLVAETAAQDD